MRKRRFVLLSFLALPGIMLAQQPGKTSAASVTGAYELRYDAVAGCKLEIEPAARDSVRVQLECNRGAPSYNLGFLDERVPFRAGTAVYEDSGRAGVCRIRMEFSDLQVVVRQQGSDLACGFGFGVYADGTYRRVSRQRPRFDLSPVG